MLSYSIYCFSITCRGLIIEGEQDYPICISNRLYFEKDIVGKIYMKVFFLITYVERLQVKY